MNNQERLEQLVNLRSQAKLGGGEKRIASQHKKGKYTARERIEMLLDDGSFEELDMFVTHRCTNFGMENEKYLGDGVVTVMEPLMVVRFMFSLRFYGFGGSLSNYGLKIKVMDSTRPGAPYWNTIRECARIQEGVTSFGVMPKFLKETFLSSGLILKCHGPLREVQFILQP